MFESPWMLAGLGALAVPLWIHLRRRRERRIPFPAVSVLARIAARRAHHIRLRNALLLAIRLLVVAAIALGMSRPGLAIERPGGIRSGMALAMVVVLDDSMSMRLRGPSGRTAFDDARDRALEEIARLRPFDGAAVVLSGRPARTLGEGIEFDLDRVRAEIEALFPGYRGGDSASALRRAARILEDSPLPQREAVVISDFAGREGFAGEIPWAAGEGIGLRAIRVASDFDAANAAIDEIRIAPSGGETSREIAVEARISSCAAAPISNAEIVLEIDGQEAAKGYVDVPARGAAYKRFHHRFGEEGTHRGLVRIGGDALPEDDARHFTAIVRRSIKVLVIDGDHLPGSYRDEAFYLHRALVTPLPGEVPIRPTVVDQEIARESPLRGNDAIFLAGVDDLDPDLARRLAAFVEEGGGLFVSPGQRGGSLESLEPILPGRIRSVRRARRIDRPFSVAAVNTAHPIFQPFVSGPSGLEGTRVWSHLLVEPDPAAERSALVDSKDGVPLLLEKRTGEGAVMLLATTVDRDWTDLPIRPGYLPLVQRAARYLADSLGAPEPRRIEVGEIATLEVTGGMQRLLVVAPDGSETVYTAKDLAGLDEVGFSRTETPGPYRIWAEVPDFGGLKEIPALEFTVETDPAESDLARGESPLPEVETEAASLVEGRFPVWPYLLLLAAILALAETWLAGLGLRRSHSRGSAAAAGRDW